MGEDGWFIAIEPEDANVATLRGDGANILRGIRSKYIKLEGLAIEGQVDQISTVPNEILFVYDPELATDFENVAFHVPIVRQSRDR